MPNTQPIQLDTQLCFQLYTANKKIQSFLSEGFKAL